MNGQADEGDWSESSDEDHQGRYSSLVAMAMSGTNSKPPTGFSPPRAQSPLVKSSTPVNTTGGALGTSLNGSFALQGESVSLTNVGQHAISPCHINISSSGHMRSIERNNMYHELLKTTANSNVQTTTNSE